MKRNYSQRGSALVLAVVLTAALAMLSVAALSFSHTELSAVRTFRSGDELVSCAEAGRKHIISMFRKLELPTGIVLDAHVEGVGAATCPADLPAGQHCVKSGHLGQTVTGVKLVPHGMTQQRNQRDLTNVISRMNLGSGQEYEVVVHCVDSRGRETEIEFGMRFGL
ncbi:MAG TPA: hypothetical protein DFS52_01105 [Myxococcales bacterium]|jgi:hypothetical protein|nr:hypothetical protein [Myxococcales bacterium]